MRRLRFTDLLLEPRGVVDLAVHGAQDGGLGLEREMLELALVGVIRVADAARACQPLDEGPQLRVECRLSGHVAAPAFGAARPSPARPAGGTPTTHPPG